MSNWKRLVEVTCPVCGYKRLAELRARGLVRKCGSCTIKAARKRKFWIAGGVAHQQSQTPLYRVWNSMKQRCDSPTCDVFADYGGRGISHCPEWNEFLPFKAWAEANGYSKGLLLDRRDNDGNYEPSNCRWVLSVVSAHNRSTTKQSVADVAVMKSLFDMGVKVGLIAALYGITPARFSDIREKVLWKQLDPTFTITELK